MRKSRFSDSQIASIPREQRIDGAPHDEGDKPIHRRVRVPDRETREVPYRLKASECFDRALRRSKEVVRNADHNEGQSI